MDWRKWIQFSLANVFWLTLVVAVVSLGITAAVRMPDAYRPWFVGSVLAVGGPPAVGALIGGLKGLGRGVVVGAWLLFVFVTLAIFLG